MKQCIHKILMKLNLLHLKLIYWYSHKKLKCLLHKSNWNMPLHQRSKFQTSFKTCWSYIPIDHIHRNNSTATQCRWEVNVLCSAQQLCIKLRYYFSVFLFLAPQYITRIQHMTIQTIWLHGAVEHKLQWWNVPYTRVVKQLCVAMWCVVFRYSLFSVHHLCW